MTAPLPRPPASLRVARAITVTQTVAATLAVGVALVYLVVFSRGADKDDGGEYAGLGAALVGLAAFFTTVLGVLTLVLGAATVGLFRGRTWGLVLTGVTEGVLLLVGARSALSGFSPVVWLLVIAPAVTVLVLLLRPDSRYWCRAAR